MHRRIKPARPVHIAQLEIGHPPVLQQQVEHGAGKPHIGRAQYRRPQQIRLLPKQPRAQRLVEKIPARLAQQHTANRANPAPGPRHHHAKRPAPLDNLRLNIRKRGKMAQLQTGQPVPIIGELR